jgi:hypothetical protein
VRGFLGAQPQRDTIPRRPPIPGQSGEGEVTAPPPRRCSHGALRTLAAERDALSLRLGTTTISVRHTAGNPPMSRAAPSSTASSGPAALLPAPPAAAKPRGNPILALAPHCGARTNAGCPCRSPAIHRKLRCRMPGGRSPDPRTPESLPGRRPGGRIRVREARTIHGNPGANARANRHRLTLLRIRGVDIALDRYQGYLPPARSAYRPAQVPLTAGPTAPFKHSRIDPLNREPTAKPGSTAPFKPFRTDPLNREPTAKPGSTAPFKPFRTDPLNREPAAYPAQPCRASPARMPPTPRCPRSPPAPMTQHRAQGNRVNEARSGLQRWRPVALSRPCFPHPIALPPIHPILSSGARRGLVSTTGDQTGAQPPVQQAEAPRCATDL